MIRFSVHRWAAGPIFAARSLIGEKSMVEHSLDENRLPTLSRSRELRERLLNGKWVIGASVLVLSLLGYFEDVAWPLLAASFLVLAFAVVLTPRKPRLAKIRAGLAQRNVWPDTRIKAAVEALPEPSFLIGPKGIVRFGNMAGHQMFPSVEVGEPLSFKLRVPEFLDALARVTQGGDAESVDYAERLPTARYFRATFTGIRLGPGNRRSGKLPPDFVLLVFRDQTEQRRVEQMRGDFIANASHELRTPLASLSGFIETLKGPARDDAEARDRFLDIMSSQAQRMSRLIDDLLSLSRIEMKPAMSDAEEIDLNNLVHQIGDTLAPLLEELNVSLEMDLPETPLHVHGVRDEMTQVFSNLIENAIKYGQSGGRVRVSGRLETRVPDGRINAVLSVRDWGPGIDAEHLPRLTERFYRVDVQTSRAKKGTGLGLAIVKHIIGRHGGRLAIRSEPGNGACFDVILESSES
ncbi:ATP-binding protein [Coralliovum pocilloporae]|uniref:ATP-binding protein n=1 Tax=Coralliovum pocilloporae TaxID=3066369 RepID=UPI003306D29F